MLNRTISNKAYQLLCLLYKTYLENIDTGEEKYDAKCFGSYDIIRFKYAPTWYMFDVFEVLNELKNSGLIITQIDNDDNLFVLLSDEGITYMENKLEFCYENVVICL